MYRLSVVSGHSSSAETPARRRTRRRVVVTCWVQPARPHVVFCFETANRVTPYDRGRKSSHSTI